MREIEFRGIIVGCEKEKEQYHKWIYGDLVRELSTGKTFILDVAHTSNGNATFNELAVEVFPETVSQFTGLLDKNDKKIFEGNIIEITYNENKIKKEVYWDREWNCWKVYINGGNIHTLNSHSIKYLIPEVIGNIHEKE